MQENCIKFNMTNLCIKPKTEAQLRAIILPYCLNPFQIEVNGMRCLMKLSGFFDLLKAAA